jgi:hypothetical protein
MLPRRRAVREPVQVYLAPEDKQLLEELAQRTGASQAEVLRRGIRRLSAELEQAERPGSSLSLLIGALDGSPDLPADLAARHDDYLYDTGADAGSH